MQRLFFATTFALATAALAVAPAAAAISSDDSSFVQSAQHDALGEYALAALARGKAESPQAKQLAATVLANATTADDFIKSFAKKNALDLDGKPSVRADTQYGNISGEKGSTFDRGFANALRIDATIAESSYQDEAKNGADPKLRAFAKEELSALQHIVEGASKLSPQ